MDVRTEERQGLTALEELLGWEEGRFVFVPGEKPRQLAWEIPIPHALLEAERRRDELHRAMGQLPPLETVFRLDAGLTEGPSFSLEAWQVLTLVNGRRTLGGILQKAKDKVNAARVLGQLLEKGVITLRVPESEDAWQSLRPSPLAAIYVDGERAFPARLRANLLLKAIDGHKTLLELSQMLNLKVEDIQEDIAYLLELRWIRFSPSEERRWAKMKGDLL